MPEPGMGGKAEHSFDGPDRDGGGGWARSGRRGGYAGAGPRAAARDPAGAFSGGVGQGGDYDPYGPNTLAAGLKYGGLLGLPGMLAGGAWGAFNEYGPGGAALGRRGGGTIGAPGGGFDPGSRDGGGDMVSRFRNWQAQGGQGGFRDFMRSGAGQVPDVGGPVNPVTGEPLYPETIDYAAATQAGVSPPAGGPLYGVGSPFAGPADVFGGM